MSQVVNITKVSVKGATPYLGDRNDDSPRCSSCGHVAEENRESQAVFLCKACGYSDNDDHNVAASILDRALRYHQEEMNKFWGGKHPSVRPYQSAPRGLVAGQHSPEIRKPVRSSTC